MRGRSHWYWSLPLMVFLFAPAIIFPQQHDIATPVSLKGMRVQHPRLILLDSQLPALREKIAADSFAASEYKFLQARALDLLTKPPVTYQVPEAGRDLLPKAREMEGRVLTLAGIYRIGGDRRFADRAIAEMLAVAAFPDWNPSHFLDSSEFAATLGIGYDWLYPLLTPAERATIRQAIVTKGYNIYIQNLHTDNVHYHNNWGQVCYGGQSLGVLGTAEPDDPDSMARASEMLSYSRHAIGELMQLLAPDGGFEEGPVYWNYDTIYNVLFLSSTESALGTDFGLNQSKGFDHTPEYRMQSIGPELEYANFGDASTPAFPAPQMFWFAAHFNRPDYAAFEKRLTQQLRGHMSDAAERESVRFAFLGLVWYALAPADLRATEAPLAASFSRTGQAYLRTGWNNPNAWFAGFKGGDAGASHGHLDLGSFVLDGLGQRWASDLGAERYQRPGYFGEQRWDYYRTRTEGHNTLTINGRNEDLDAHASVLFASSSQQTKRSVLDLDNAYKAVLQSWRRGIAILDGKRVLIEDEFAPKAKCDVVWHWHTLASVQIDPGGDTATLTRDAAAVKLHILSPKGARFSLADANPANPPQSPNPGITDLVIRDSGVDKPERIAVAISAPDEAGETPLSALRDWQ